MNRFPDSIEIDVDAITVPEVWRRIDEAKVVELAKSIDEVGLLHPIALTDQHVLIAGKHRLRAHKLLGRETIRAQVFDLEGDALRLAQIDENLTRNEGSALERSDCLAERKRLYLRLHPETAHGGARASGQAGHSTPRFTAETAKLTKVGERTVRRQVRMSEQLDDSVRDAVASALDAGSSADADADDARRATRATKLADSPGDLLALSRLSPEKQAAAVDLVLSGEVAKGSVAVKRTLDADRIATAAAACPEISGIELLPCTARKMLEDTPDGAFHFVTTDTPWVYDQSQRGAASDQYSGITPAETVVDMALAYEKAADDCYLVTHVTCPFVIPFARAVIHAEMAGKWPWRDLSAGAWGKRIGDGDNIGAGYHLRGDGELWILWAKGKPTPFGPLSNWHAVTRPEHSEKDPDWIRAMLKALCPQGGLVGVLYAGRCPEMRACSAGGFRMRAAEPDPKRREQARAELATYTPQLFSFTGH